MNIKLQRKKNTLGPEANVVIRVSHKKETTKLPRYTISCGCCNEKFTVCYDTETGFLEIGGVGGSLENWREILLPLLCVKSENGKFEDVSPAAQRARKVLREMRKKYP